MQRKPKKIEPRKFQVKTNAGVFVLEVSALGLCRIRFPKAGPHLSRNAPSASQNGSVVSFGEIQDKRCLLPLLRKLRSRKLDLSGSSTFERKVYTALLNIPVGKTISYGELARNAGYPGAARAVGTAMKKNRLPIVIPCHRVVPARGGLGEYAAGRHWKQWLLRHEGVSR